MPQLLFKEKYNYENTKNLFAIAVFFLVIVATSTFSFAATRTITYTYDNLDRLASVSYGGEASISSITTTQATFCVF